jgi:phosphohistidine swiveling domain-containing protein
MTEGKVAAQVAHPVKNLSVTPVDCDIIVLKVSDKKFDELVKENDCYVQTDKGLTGVARAPRQPPPGQNKARLLSCINS